MFDDQSNVAGLTAFSSGSPVTPRIFIAAVTGPPSPEQSCPTSTGRRPAHSALLTDRKPPATFAFALAHGCAGADAGANSASAAIDPAPATAALKALPINCSSRGIPLPSRPPHQILMRTARSAGVQVSPRRATVRSARPGTPNLR